MKNRMSSTAMAGLVAVAAIVPTAQAVDWDGSESNEWTVDGNWDASYPNAAGAVANFGIAAAVNVSSPITVGQITDTGAGTDSWLNSLTASGTGSITFDNNGADALFNATVHFYRTPPNSTYSVPMVLNDNLVINYWTQRNRNFNGPISGSGHLTLNISGNDGVSFSMSGSSANTYSGGTTVNNNKQFSWNTPPLVLLDKDGAMGTGDVTLVAVSAHGASKVTITSSGGTEDRIDDSAMLTLNYDATGGYTVVTLDTGVEETVGGLTLNGVVQPAGTYNATTHSDWFAGGGDLIVGGGSAPSTLAITSITSLGGWNWELTLKGEPSTAYQFNSSTTLAFTPGDLVTGLTATVGDISGDSDEFVTTDGDGDATVEMALSGDPADFVRAQRPPPVTLLDEDFEDQSTLPLLGWETDAYPADTATTTWDLGTPSIVGPVPPGVPLPSASNCVGTNLDANYGLSSDIWLRTPPIDLSTATGATLTFQHWVDIDPFGNADKGTVRVLDASALPTVSVLETLGADITGLSPTGWVEFSADLTAASLGNSVVLEFVFVSDNDDDSGNQMSSGWYIDDVVVTGTL